MRRPARGRLADPDPSSASNGCECVDVAVKGPDIVASHAASECRLVGVQHVAYNLERYSRGCLGMHWCNFRGDGGRGVHATSDRSCLHLLGRLRADARLGVFILHKSSTWGGSAARTSPQRPTPPPAKTANGAGTAATPTLPVSTEPRWSNRGTKGVHVPHQKFSTRRTVLGAG